jgi:hypothetical protein
MSNRGDFEYLLRDGADAFYIELMTEDLPIKRMFDAESFKSKK